MQTIEEMLAFNNDMNGGDELESYKNISHVLHEELISSQLQSKTLKSMLEGALGGSDLFKVTLNIGSITVENLTLTLPKEWS